MALLEWQGQVVADQGWAHIIFDVIVSIWGHFEIIFN